MSDHLLMHDRLDSTVHFNPADDSYNYYVNGGHWTLASGGDLVLMYDHDGNLFATYAVKHPVTDLHTFDRLISRMLDAGVGL